MLTGELLPWPELWPRLVILAPVAVIWGFSELRYRRTFRRVRDADRGNE
jgi:hypothetical protein